MKKIKMQYPLDRSNPVLDGRVHEIVISEMERIDINGEPYYLMSYNDITAGNRSMITFLRNVNGVLCKVPLKEYNFERINSYLRSCPRRVLSSKEIEELVPDVIGLAETTTIENIANNQQIGTRNVTIQYPYSSLNEGIDGTVHQVTPIRIVRCNVHGFDLYFMVYYDHNLGHEMITFLIRIDGALYKVPLTTYNLEEIRAFVEAFRIAEVDPSSLFAGAGIPTDKPAIGLTLPMSLRDLTNIKLDPAKGKNVIDYPYYIPYNMDNPMNISDRVFRSSCHVYHENIEDFLFDKEKTGGPIEQAIREGIRNNLDKVKRGEAFSFDIEVEIPAGTTVTFPTKDGRLVAAVYVPGIHKHTVHMAPCLKPKMDKPTRLCERLSIRTLDDDYGTFEDDPVVFREGYAGKLPVTFLGMPRDYVDRVTFYADEEPPQKDETFTLGEVSPTDTENYARYRRIVQLMEAYINAMNVIYDKCDGVMFDSKYAERYSANLLNGIRIELEKMGYDVGYINGYLKFIQEEFLKRRSGAKKGL